MAMTNVIQQLKNEVEDKNLEIKKINKAITLLQNGKGTRQYTTGRRMSPEAIEKIRASQKKLWANKRKASESK